MNWEELKEKLVNSEYHYFHTDNGVLLCGDCLEVMKEIPDKSIDLVVSSPPYDNLRYYSAKNEKKLVNLWNFDKFKITAKELYRVIKDGGVVVWIVGDATINGSETGNSFRQALYFKDDCGFNLHDTMIYKKHNFSNPSYNRYHQIFEYMFVFSKGKPKTFNPIMDRKNKYAGKSCWGKNTTRQKNGSLIQSEKRICRENGMRHNIWEYVVSYGFTTRDEIAYRHPAIFPEQLAHDHIISWSNQDDVILDSLCGSGTTLKMAEKLKRKWIGIEISKKYCEIAYERILKRDRKQKPLF